MSSVPLSATSDASGEITLSGTSYVAGSYDIIVQVTGESCPSVVESTSLVDPGSPDIDPISSYEVCDGSYTLGSISGTDLTSSVAYYDYDPTGSGTGSTIPVGTLYDTAGTDITIYAYDSLGVCSDIESFRVVIPATPVITNPGLQEVCSGGYELLSITGTGLTGNEKYSVSDTHLTLPTTSRV